MSGNSLNTNIAAFGDRSHTHTHTHNVWIAQNTHCCWIIADHWNRSVFRYLLAFCIEQCTRWLFFIKYCCLCYRLRRRRHCRCHCCCIHFVVVIISPMFNGDQLWWWNHIMVHIYISLIYCVLNGLGHVEFAFVGTLSHAHAVTQAHSTNFRVAKQVPRDVVATQQQQKQQ